jgi:hypothetical protein
VYISFPTKKRSKNGLIIFCFEIFYARYVRRGNSVEVVVRI